MHNITPKAPHIIINAKLAMHSDLNCIENIADGINETLREAVNADLLADYQFDSINTATVFASSSPEEDELFLTTPPANTNEPYEKIVWVAACESLDSGSFLWFENKKYAEKEYQENCDQMTFDNSQCHFFAFAVDPNVSNDVITDLVDEFYYNEAATKEEFNLNPNVRSYPYHPKAWLKICNNHFDNTK
ncbi:hypothetical protein [Photobacterium leiognathi]|uniref:hypothetical protein n=1 Tax=Photobacterium leiognathi TaxID=553611 RepID=UPI0029822FB4|nr:hypothetical protein [Photobacterium leiognathi]